MDLEIPPIKEDVNRVAAQLNYVQEMWREGEKRAILSKYSGGDRSRVPDGKYTGLDHLDIACVRSPLNAQLREPAGLTPRMLEDWQTNIKAAMDSTTSGSGDELIVCLDRTGVAYTDCPDLDKSRRFRAVFR